MDRHTRFFTATDGVRIAYAVVGSGRPLVSVPPWLSHLEMTWDMPALRAFNEELARRFTLVLYDRWGSGLSDRSRSDFSHDADVRVLAELVDHLRLRRFALWGVSAGGRPALSHAVEHPRRVSRLILFGTWVQDKPSQLVSPLRELTLAHWGLGSKTYADYLLPGAGAEYVVSAVDPSSPAAGDPAAAVSATLPAVQDAGIRGWRPCGPRLPSGHHITPEDDRT